MILSAIIACPICLSTGSTRSSDAAAWTLIFMLSLLAFMFTCIGAVIYKIVQRQRRAAESGMAS